MLLSFAERSVERRECDEECPDFPHRVFDSLPCTLHLCLISHGPGRELSCVEGGRYVLLAASRLTGIELVFLDYKLIANGAI